LANWVVFCIPFAIFYFLLSSRRWAYHLGVTYAGMMILSSLRHNIGTMATGNYSDGYAVGYTRIAFVLIGPPMIYYLRKEIPSNKSNHDN
jgi:hypothetical protein